jgi:hypothetical protein
MAVHLAAWGEFENYAGSTGLPYRTAWDEKYARLFSFLFNLPLPEEH